MSRPNAICLTMLPQKVAATATVKATATTIMLPLGVESLNPCRDKNLENPT